MFDKAFLKSTKPFVDAVALHLSKRGVMADQLTFVGFGFGMLAAGLIALSHPMLAIVPIVLGRVCDGLDGAVARITHSQTDRGAFLDIALDFVFYASIPLAFVFTDTAHNGLAGAVLLAAFITTGTSFLAYAAIAAKRRDNPTLTKTVGLLTDRSVTFDRQALDKLNDVKALAVSGKLEKAPLETLFLLNILKQNIRI